MLNIFKKKKVDKQMVNQLFGYVHENKIEKVRELLDVGINIDTKNILGKTVLFFASKYGYTEIVKLLLERGANVNIKYFDGLTPLYVSSLSVSAVKPRLFMEGI